MRGTSIVVAGIAVSLLMVPADLLQASVYDPGFTWDWRIDFGTPTSVSELPANPNSDARSRALPQNAGLSDGTQVDSVWAYGKAPYGAFTGYGFTASSFTPFTVPHTFYNGAVWDDAAVLDFNWDFIGWIPGWYAMTRAAHVFNHDTDAATASVLRFTYPGETSINLQIAGVVEDLNLGGGDGVDWLILKNTSADVVGSGQFGNGGKSTVDLVTSMSPGDELFVVIGAFNANCAYDETAVDLTFQVIVDNTPPAISSTVPANNSLLNTPSLSTIMLAFSETMDTSSLANLAAYHVVRNGSVAVLVSGTSYDPATRSLRLELNQGQPLVDGNYLVTVYGDLLLDVAGNALDGNGDGQPGGQFGLSFVVDTTPPHVTQIDPAAGSTTLPEGSWIIEVFFDSTVAPANAQATTSYRLIGSGGDNSFASGNEFDVAINMADYDLQTRSVLVLVNDGFDLPIDLYKLTVRSGSPGILDLAGNALDGDGDGLAGGDYVAQFRVIGPCGQDSDLDGVGDLCDLCPNTIVGAAVDADGCPAPIRYDIDRDGDVDGTDFLEFQLCETGPGIEGPPNPDCTAAVFSVLDVDGDHDIDQVDFGFFQRCLSGANNPADPHCAD